MEWGGVEWGGVKCGEVRVGWGRVGVVWCGVEVEVGRWVVTLSRGGVGWTWSGVGIGGMVWYGMVWYGMVWYGIEWHGMERYGTVRYGMGTFRAKVRAPHESSMGKASAQGHAG